MAAAKVILTVTAGTHNGKQFVLEAPKTCMVGRARDCAVRLSGGLEDSLVSRHHCQLDLEGPRVRVQDLGSRNGTYINGWLVKTSASAPQSEQATEILPRDYELVDGDELRVGPVPLLVSIR
jgi:pSer/pThr/pTyr-binding forkhead associated (FHA) protein